MAKSDEELATKRGKVELTSRWVSRAWPEEVKKKPAAWPVLVTNIKDFEKYKRNPAKTKVLILLTNIHGNLDDCQNQCKTILSSYPKTRSKLIKELEAAKKLAEAQKKIAADSSGSLTVLWRMKLGPRVEKWLPSKFGISLKEHLYEFKVPAIVVHELEERNLDNTIYDEFDKLLNAFASKCADEMVLEIHKPKYNGMMTKDLTKEMEKIFSKWLDHFESAAAEIPGKIIRDSAIHEEIAKRYEKERKIALAKSGLAVGLSTAGMFAPGTQAVAAVGVARSGAALCKELYGYFAHIERKLNDLKNYLKILEKAYVNGVARGVSEISMSTLNGALGIDVMPTIAKAKDDLEDLLKNASLSATRLREKQRKLKELTEKAAKFEAEWQNAKTTGKTTKIDKKCEELQTKFVKKFEIAATSMERLKKVETALPQIKTKLDQIGDNPLGLKIGAQLMKSAATITLSVVAVADVSMVCKDLELAAGLWANSAALLSDIADEVEGIVG